jgi:hypothetical protein
MDYEIIYIPESDGTQKPYLILTFEDGSGKTFAADTENPEYAAWVEANGEPELPPVPED